jgi:hypothetical protein
VAPHRHLLRLLVVLATVASVLVPAAIAPAKTIQIPQTMARSAVIGEGGTARLAFPATHLAFSWTGDEGSGVRYRTGAGEWTTAPEAHDLEKGSTHYSGVLSVDDPQSVQVEQLGWGLHPASDIRLHYMNTQDGPLRTVTVPSVAAAAATTPDVVRRAEWGADERLKDNDGGCERIFYPLQQLFVHHTAGSNADPDPYATMRAVYQFHTQTRGWCDVGYNFVVAQDGTVFEGRWTREFAPWETPTSEDSKGRAAAGAHVSGFNSGSIGVSLMGNFSTGAVPVAARASLVQVLGWITDRHNLDPEAKHDYRNPETGLTKRLPVIAGHRDGGSTDCPGDNLYRALPSIRKEVAVQIGPGRQKSRLTLKPAARRITYGSSTGVSGVLSDESGAPLSGRVVTIYFKEAGARWKTLAHVTSSLDGSFRSSSSPEKNTQFAALYAGDATTWEGQSPKKAVAVKPIIALTARDAKSDLSGSYRYPAESTRATLSGTVEPALPGRSMKVLIFRIGSDGTESQIKEKAAVLDDAGSFTVPFRFQEAGVRYRAVAWYARDGGFSSARSNSVIFERDV